MGGGAEPSEARRGEMTEMTERGDPPSPLPPLAASLLASLRSSPAGYSAIDFGLLDPHYGTLDDWVALIDAIHQKGMYLIADFTVGTMGDLIGFKGHLNSSTPFSLDEYDAVWKM